MDRLLDLLDLLREARPEIVGGLVVAAVLAVASTIFALGRFLRNRLRPKPQPPVVEEKKEPEPPRPVPKPEKLPVPKFISRRDEQGHDLVEEVSEALKKAALVVIWGTGGVGKTTLATEVANRLFESRYKGGVIWADADDVADFDFISFLDTILDALERQDARTLALDPKKRLVTRLLGEEDSRLIVLDNFEAIASEERSLIVPFLCTVPCAALVGSRRRIDRAENIHLPPMSHQEALDFLKMAARNTKFASKLSESQLEEVALAADRNPLLMQWVVGQMEKARALDEVLAKIKAGEGETAERIFDRSYKLLSPDGQSALLALALFVPSASRQALGVVAGFGQPGNWFQRLIGRLRPGKTPAARLQQALEELATLALLEPRDVRLGLLRLTRELALARLEKEGRGKELRERFILYFLAYAQAHPEVTKKDLDALDEERENLLAALDYAYAAENWPSVMSITDAIAFPGLLDIRGYWDEAIKWGERAAEAASQANLPISAAVFSGDVGVIRDQRGDYVEAQQAFGKALLFFQEDGDERNVAVALHNLGTIAQEQGDYLQARDLYNQSLEIDKQLGNQAGIAKSLHQLGRIAELQGHYQEAKDLYNQSLEIKRNLGDQAGIAKSLGQLGLIAQRQDDYQQAEELYNQSLEIKIDLGDQRGIAFSLHQLGTLAEERGQVEEAAQFYREALEIFDRLGVPEAEIARESLARVAGKQTKE